MRQLLELSKPDAVAIEELFFGSLLRGGAITTPPGEDFSARLEMI